jgi:catechol 2,3-dioxygenase-like lactoylglutathione lyase family enzyme
VQVEEVDFVQIPSRDVKRAAEWYRDMLGLPISKTTTRDAEVDPSNVTLRFWNPEEMGVEFQPNLSGIALRVPDVEEARRELEAKGVEFMSQTYDTSVCLMAMFRDPDGNVIILHRRYKPRAQ